MNVVTLILTFFFSMFTLLLDETPVDYNIVEMGSIKIGMTQ